MRSRLVSVAVVLLVLVVTTGVLVGLGGPGAMSMGGIPASPRTLGIVNSSGAAAVSSPIFGFVGGSSSTGPAYSAAAPGSSFGIPFSAGAATTVTRTTVVSSSSVSSAPGNVAIGSNPQGQKSSSLSGAPLAAATSVNASHDIEFFTNLTLQASSTSAAFAKATEIAYADGGYVAYSTETNSTALVEMRVPAANYEGALAQVEALGTLVNLRSTSNDVTVQYSDMNATLASLQAEEASLLKILSQSTNINSTLNVESRIQVVDQQINEVQSAILQTRTLISYATISAFIEEKAPVQPLTIKLTATPRSGNSPLSVTFNAVTKGGTQPYIVNYNFGDGTSYEGQALIHTFQQTGHFNVTVTATDASANVTEAWTTVDVSSPPATSSFAGFPSQIGGLFLQVVEGIAEVAVVVMPIVAVILVVLFPLRYRLGLSSKRTPENDKGSA